MSFWNINDRLALWQKKGITITYLVLDPISFNNFDSGMSSGSPAYKHYE
jgi:hypothetical protein